MKNTKMLLAVLMALAIPSSSFAMLSEVKTGPIASSDGSVNPSRSDKSGALVNTEGHGRYQEPTYRGNVFLLDSDQVTIAAGNVTKTAIGGTAKFINGFYNPQGSGKAAAILNANVSTISGTPGGPLTWDYYCMINETSSATGTIHPAVLTNSAGNSSMSPKVNVVLTAGSVASNVIQLSTLGGPAAIAAGAGNYNVTEDVAGRIIVPPGCVFGVMATALGTTHIVQSTLSWEEIAYP